MPELPVVKALLLCDYVILDRDTGKNSFIGVFHSIYAPRFPAQHPPIWVVAELTDIAGTHSFEFALVNQGRSDGPQVIAQGTLENLTFPSRHEIYTIRFQTGPIPIPGPGRYDLEFSCDGTLIESQTFQVRTPAPPPETAEN